MVTGITLIVLSLIAVPSLIIAKRTNAQQLLDKIAPYQGVLGVMFTFWGLYGIVFSGLLNVEYFTNRMIYWLVLLAVNITQTILGFVLGYGMILKYVFSKNETAIQKGRQLLLRLAHIQGKMALFGLMLGVSCVLLSHLLR